MTVTPDTAQKEKLRKRKTQEKKKTQEKNLILNLLRNHEINRSYFWLLHLQDVLKVVPLSSRHLLVQQTAKVCTHVLWSLYMVVREQKRWGRNEAPLGKLPIFHRN